MATRSAPAPARAPKAPAVRYRDIVAGLRRDIISGKLLPGQRLPTQARLQARWHTTPVTAQRAIRELARTGFLRTQERRGLFVAECPPHLCRYALIFEPDPTELEAPPWSRLYAALANEASALQRLGGITIEPFYGVRRRLDSKDYRRLVQELDSHQFAGLIFVQSPHSLVRTPLLAHDGLPRVAIMSEPRYPHVPAVAFGLESFLDRALDYLAERRRRRVAMICLSHLPRELLDRYAAGLKTRKLITRPYWTLRMSLPADGVTSWVQLLCHRDLPERPDALVVEDDNLVEPAVAGLIAAAIRVPQDMEVVAHCNIPWAGLRTLPLAWLGFDIRQVLRTCLGLLDAQRRGRPVPRLTTSTAVFEPETRARETTGEELANATR